MVNMEKYENLLNEGLMLDHYLVLIMLQNGQKLSSHKRVEGFINTLHKRGYLEEGGLLSDKAISLLADDIFQNLGYDSNTTTTTIAPDVLSFNDWVYDLHGKLQAKLVELTGKKQVRDSIKGGKPQSFLCNPQDLGSNLKRVITKYKLKEENRIAIERTLLNHIDSCYKSNNWFPLMYYYIIKEGASKMITDLQESDELQEDSFTSETII